MSRFVDINERGIYTDLLRKFRNEGHQVFIVAPAERRYNQSTFYSKSDGNTHILNVRTLNLQKTSLLEKGVGLLLIERQFLKAIKRFFKNVKYDLIIYSTPPISLTKVVSFIKKRDNALSYLLLKDIFPQNAVDLGMMKPNGLIHRYFKKKEHSLYESSDYIGCMSPANVNFIVDHNPQINKLKVEHNPNSIELQVLDIDCEKKKEISTKYNLPTCATIFVYGGNLGKPQGIDFLIKLLISNIFNKKVFFLIVGDGTEYVKLNNWVKANKPENVLLLRSIPKTDYDKLVSVCDVGMIFLDRRFTIPNFPSRLLSYLEHKLPIIAATDANTDIGIIAEQNNFGKYCLSEDLSAFNKILNYFCDNKEEIKQMGLNGFKYLQQNYLVEQSYKTIIDHINV